MNHDLYTRLHLWLTRHRRLVLAATLVVTAISFAVSSHIRLEEDILEMLPKNNQRVDEYRYALRKFRQMDRVYIDVSVGEDDPDRLARATDAMHASLATNPAYARILYRFEEPTQAKVVGFLTGALPNLFTKDDFQSLEKKLEPGEVRSFLTVMRRKLAGPEGMALKNVVSADPIGGSALVLNKILPLQTGFNHAQIVDGRITTEDGRHALILAEPKFNSSNSGESEKLVIALLQAARETERQFPGVRVAITGGHRMAVDNATLIKSDAKRCIFLGMAAMLVLCLTAFRRRWLSLVAFLPSFFGTLMAGAVLALWNNHLSAIATGFAAIAIGITVDYAIYVIYQLDNAPGLDVAAVGRHIGRLVTPITAGALTSMTAFAMMTTSPIGGYQQLGVFGTVGVLFSAAFALVILPLLVPVPKRTGQTPLWMTRWMERFHKWSVKRRLWLIAAMLAVTLVTAFGVKRLRFDGNLNRLNGITTATRHDEEFIRETWGDALGMTLVVARGTNLEQALVKNDFATDALGRVPEVTAVYSLASVCPAVATQRENIRRWHEFWSASRRQALRQTLAQVGGELGFRADAFDPFWRVVDSQPQMITLETFRGSPLEEALSERVALGDDDIAISTLIKLADHSQVEKLRAALPGMIVLDNPDFVAHIAALAKQGLEHFALWTGIVVAVIVYLFLGSIELVVAALLPLAFGLLWTFGLMGWLGLPIDLMNSVFVIFIIGVGEDYSVFFVTSKLDEWRGRPPRLAATSASVVISAFSTMIGFAVLVIARHPVLFSMGTTVLIGMGFTFAATLVLTPMCMDLLLFRDPPRGAPRWWHLCGTAWVSLYMAAGQLFLYCGLRPILKIVSPRTADEKLRRATSSMTRGMIRFLPFGKLELKQITSVTFSPPCISISNHQSAVDVMLVVSWPADVRQTAKKRVFDAPMLGIGCRLLGHIMVEPNDPQTTLRRCREKLAEGACVHFYPEGTRSWDGSVERFHRGAFDLAVQLNQDILPIVLCDTNTAMPRDSYWFEPCQVRIRALPRVTPQTFDYSQGALALMRHCENAVRAGLQQDLDQLNTPRIVRRKVRRLYRYQGKFVEQFIYWKLKCDPMFEALDEVVPRSGHILDLGCGYGLASQWLACFTPGRTFLGVDYDEEKIRVAQRSAPGSARLQFLAANILDLEFPSCDAVLLLDVLHYWQAEKQQAILDQARRALRPGGRLILREAMRAETAEHRQVDRWEKFATRIGHNRTREGLHFRTQAEIEAALRQAGFGSWTIKPAGRRNSNVLFVCPV